MATIAVFLNMDEQRVVSALQEAGENLDATQGEAVLNFSSVLRIDSACWKRWKSCHHRRREDGQGCVARRQHKHLQSAKLVKLTRRFSFLN